ncbi:MAG: MBL fold metallo-hydrolase [Bacillota bacterium]|nr:MBL fold metallo-hydrolase [Bacillota bacterium]
MTQLPYQVRFWGVRGSLPVPGQDTVVFGGNTDCVQIQIGHSLFIMDAGTGIFNLGKHLVEQNAPISGDIFITHTHWDHIQGFPFFGPAFIGGNHFTLYGQSKTDLTFADLMKGQMMHEHFPISLDKMGARISFQELNAGDKLNLGDEVMLTTVHNNHPGGGLSYRLDHAGRSCCYVTDTEHTVPPDNALSEFVQNTNLLIYEVYAGDCRTG